MKGDIKVGEVIEVQLQNMKFKPCIEVYDYQKELTWLGHLFFKGLFDGRHSFRFEAIDEKKCRLVHSESFSGLLVSVFKNKLMTETKAGFEEMNEKLKERIESMNN